MFSNIFFAISIPSYTLKNFIFTKPTIHLSHFIL